MAIGLVTLLLEDALVELLEAKGADKVLNVVLAEHGGDALADDRLAARGAQRPALGVVVRLAVGHALVVVEGPANERLMAVPAHEALCVPLGVQPAKKRTERRR